MLKHSGLALDFKGIEPAAFGRLCVETGMVRLYSSVEAQPPSGGCVLKLDLLGEGFGEVGPAAFGRLCVETSQAARVCSISSPAAFGRLCVETSYPALPFSIMVPAAFGRLCVETIRALVCSFIFAASRLRAAVC